VGAPAPMGSLQTEPIVTPSMSPSRFYVESEYLLWFIKRDTVPPLVTTGPPEDRGAAGVLGRSGTQGLFGGGLDRGAQWGARFTAGYWLDDCSNSAVELSGFFLGQGSKDFNANSSQFPVLARPFFDLQTGMPSVQQVAFPTRASGSVQVQAP